MGEHKHREGIKGDGYKKLQRVAPYGRWVIFANVKDKWLIKHGWVKGEDGKWHRR
jgi:hypothetical protein